MFSLDELVEHSITIPNGDTSDQYLCYQYNPYNIPRQTMGDQQKIKINYIFCMFWMCLSKQSASKWDFSWDFELPEKSHKAKDKIPTPLMPNKDYFISHT